MSDPRPTMHHHNCLTGETTQRELTDEEIANLPEPSNFTIPE
jgi:hypothetical protein